MNKSQINEPYINEPYSHSSLSDVLRVVFGPDAAIAEQKRIYGGDINDAWELRLSGGQRIFMKTNQIKNFQFFETEQRGLEALRFTGAIGVPNLLGIGIDRQRGISFLLLDFIDSAPKVKDYWEVFGQQLAKMHRSDCQSFVKPFSSTEEIPAAGHAEHLPAGEKAKYGFGEDSYTAGEKARYGFGEDSYTVGEKVRYGFIEDNYIGATAQMNSPREKWADFFRDCRLAPQIKMAEKYFDARLSKKMDRLLEHLEDYLREPNFPSLVHGDLWGGNVLCGSDGRAWLIDPAAYVGDAETDLAMTELFGRFPQTFYDAYNEVNPIDRGYRERKKIYQLYHLLNHLNLFGRSYLRSVTTIVDEL